MDTRQRHAQQALTVVLLACVVVLGSVVVYLQIEIAGLNSSLADIRQNGSVGICGMNNESSSFDFSSESSQITSASGLAMNLTVSSGSVRSGDTIFANVSLLNTLDSNLSLPLVAKSSTFHDWETRSAYPCGSGLPVQMAVFDGYYTPSNFSMAGEPMQLADVSVTVMCSTAKPSPSSIVILPRSGIAYGVSSVSALNGLPFATSASLEHWSCSPQGVGGSVCSTEAGASGYYGSVTLTENGLRLFHFGQYTIAAVDIWGDTVLVHFTVQ